jgi:hypothetical protein
MSFEDLKLSYVVSCFVLGLIVLSPTLAMVITLPGGERFSELWILGPGHMAEDYPFNVSTGEVYNVYLGVGNHMDGLEYYMVCVKFRNQSEALPNATAGMPSPLSPLYEYRVFLEDGESWEAPLNFSFSGVLLSENQYLVERLRINGVVFTVDKLASWDGENNGYFYQLFIELWIYSVDLDEFRFHNRFVGVWLNMGG